MMDPNENLKELLDLAHGIVNVADPDDPELDPDTLHLAELVIELNEHIEGGGELPESWSEAV